MDNSPKFGNQTKRDKHKKRKREFENAGDKITKLYKKNNHGLGSQNRNDFQDPNYNVSY